jgi:hypothetical protein
VALGSQPHFLQPSALPLQLRYQFPDPFAPFRHPLIIPGGRLLTAPRGLGPPLSHKHGPGVPKPPARKWWGGPWEESAPEMWWHLYPAWPRS